MLAKKGYFAGDPQKVLSAPVDVICDILNFEDFERAYETEFDALNMEGE